MDSIRVVFLGTGAAAPTRTRNVSSLAIVLDGRTLLFDCGEGTQHQLQRSTVHPGSIEAIFITHLHGDHLFGLPGLLATLGLNGRAAPLTIVGPTGLREFLEAVPYLGAPYPISILPLPPGEGGAKRRVRGAALAHHAAGFDVLSTQVDHSVDCHAYCVVEHDRRGTFDVARATALGVPPGPLFGRLQRGEDIEIDGRTIHSSDVLGPPRRGRRIAFVTDTRPCDAAIDLARGADLLIHEATYANDHAGDARDRFHSTAEEAAKVAAAAGVKALVLTHLSARYEDATPLLEEARAVFPEVSVAADLQEIVVR
jgi:ribonuclease Z